MKVTLKYEEAQTEDLFMTLRLTLPQKYVNGTNKEVVKLFVDHYNKKKADNMLSSEDLHLKIVGGIHLDNEERVRDSLSNGDECYLLGKDSEGPAPKRQEAEKGYQCTPAAASSTTESKVAKNADGKVRCKNFGCQMTFDPNGPPQECQHHKSAPIFHETAKWWSCCPDKKAYEFDEFMRIPGCTKGFCSSESQGKKRFLGGADLRADTAPVRLDANAPPDPRQKLNSMRRGLVAVGVDADLFDKVAGKLAESGDLEKVCEVLKSRFAAALNASE
ncbi:ITGB1BP2 [Symbiodinium sp. CCMP2592]|nr:ITGB1BP2 [Symbiodinium sp. CCMP2592]